MEFKEPCLVHIFEKHLVDIGTEWNLKGKISDYLYRTQKVDIGTEWNLKPEER